MEDLVTSLKPVAKQVATGYMTKKTNTKGNGLAVALTPAIPVAMDLASGFISKKRSPGGTDEIAMEACSNNTPKLEALLEKDPFADRVPAIVAAAGKGKISALDILLNTPDVPRSNKHHHKQDASIVPRETQKKWLNTLFSGTTALLAAVERNHTRTTDFLLETGADPNICHKRGSSALHLAIRTENLQIVRSLVSYGADVDKKDSAGDTALIVASRWGLADIAHCLLQNGAGMEIKNQKGGTALLMAARHDCVDVLELLLRKGADVRAQDRKGQSALHRAVEGRWLVEQVPARVKKDMLKLLLEAGADPRMKDGTGKTASQTISWMEGGSSLRRMLDEQDRENRSRGRDRERRRDRRSSF